jgi:hypothetical protein
MTPEQAFDRHHQAVYDFAFRLHKRKRLQTMLRALLLVFLIVLLIAALPAWPYSVGWGYYPSGRLVLLVALIIVFALLGPRAL